MATEKSLFAMPETAIGKKKKKTKTKFFILLQLSSFDTFQIIVIEGIDGILYERTFKNKL